jgi:hypothetical protein
MSYEDIPQKLRDFLDKLPAENNNPYAEQQKQMPATKRSAEVENMLKSIPPMPVAGTIYPETNPTVKPLYYGPPPYDAPTQLVTHCFLIERISDNHWLTWDLEWTTDPHKVMPFPVRATALKWVEHFYKGVAIVTEHYYQ